MTTSPRPHLRAVKTLLVLSCLALPGLASAQTASAPAAAAAAPAPAATAKRAPAAHAPKPARAVTDPSAPAPAAPPPAAPPVLAPAPGGDALDFDLLAPAPVISPAEQARREALQHSLEVRRTMLTVHQAIGFGLLVGMATTVVLGQLNYHDKYGGGGDSGKYIAAHEIAALSTSALFAAGGLLALFAPSPLASEQGLSTSKLHKTFMAVATAGMVAEIALGILSAHNEGSLSQRNYALAHQVNGYVTAAAVAAGFTVLTF